MRAGHGTCGSIRAVERTKECNGSCVPGNHKSKVGGIEKQIAEIPKRTERLQNMN